MFEYNAVCLMYRIILSYYVIVNGACILILALYSSLYSPAEQILGV